MSRWCKTARRNYAAKPQWAGSPIEQQKSGRDLMIAVDLSAAMLGVVRRKRTTRRRNVGSQAAQEPIAKKHHETPISKHRLSKEKNKRSQVQRNKERH